MQQQGINILPYDLHPPPPDKCWTKVWSGNPSILKTKKQIFPSDSVLFLCYPDEGCSVGLECLSNILETSSDSRDTYCQYIIHVGELIHTGCASGSPQAPWGRSSSPDFQVDSFISSYPLSRDHQVKLSEHYHCVLVHPLLSFPFSRDFLTVWKRTVTINMKEEDRQRDAEEGGEGEEESDDDEWADIPITERLFNQSQTITTPAYRHLLETNRPPISSSP